MKNKARPTTAATNYYYKHIHTYIHTYETYKQQQQQGLQQQQQKLLLVRRASQSASQPAIQQHTTKEQFQPWKLNLCFCWLSVFRHTEPHLPKLPPLNSSPPFLFTNQPE